MNYEQPFVYYLTLAFVFFQRSLCKGKGSILKQTVEYIKKLQRDQEKTKLLEIKVSELDAEFRKIAARLEVLC
jgi:hypothetical protein